MSHYRSYDERPGSPYAGTNPYAYAPESPPRAQPAMRLLPPTTGTAHDEEEEDPELEPFVYGSRREYVNNALVGPRVVATPSPSRSPSNVRSRPASPLVPMAVAKAAKKMHSHDELEAEITTMLGGSSLLSGGEQGSAQGNSTPGRPSSRAKADDDGPPLRLKTPKPTVRPLPEEDGPRRITLSSLDPLWNTNTQPGPQGPGPQTPDSKGNTDPSGTSSTYARPSTGDYDPLYYDAPSAASTSYVDSQVPTNLGTIPNLAPSGQARYARHPRSPPRSWSPSRSPVRGPRASNVSYEPIDINGRSRPGTPSTMYGGSPRRPLPRAPTAAAPTEEASIDIDAEEDPFSDSRRGANHSRLGSRASTKTYSTYYSDSTITGNAEEEESSKVPLSDDDDLDDEDEYEGDSTSIDSRLNGPAPKGPHQRRGARPAQMTRKQVRLINGQLVLECKIPTTLSHFLPRRDDREFTHMRYTAVTCDPDDFVSSGYKLRQQMGRSPRETEILVCVTMYNEDEFDFTRTMHGIMKNISYFCQRTRSRTWGREGWQKIVVCVIADGRTKVHPRTLNALAALGVYQEGIAKNVVNQKEVHAHVYEYTSQVSLASDMQFRGAEKGIVPCQMILCLKEQNSKKLNSHRWLFNAFGQALNPNVCIMLDVGTKPANNALYHLWKAFDTDSNVAGAAGEIKAAKGKGWRGLLNPLVASQNFEYKMSNILDKPVESVFGYISVLPGALSAYRYHALKNNPDGTGPLAQYFKGETLHGKNADVFTANMYLAEDRILCWELVAKRGEQWVLKFVKSATGETDVPDAVPEFISQRRRWLNGAFFAAVYSLVHFRQIWQTDHTFGRKLLLHVEFLYQFIQLLFTFFSMANFYLTFYFIAGSLADSKNDPFGHNIGKYIFYVLRYSCILLIYVNFILSMGNRPQGAKKMFLTGMIMSAVIMAYTTFAALYMVITQLLKNGVEMGSNAFTNVVVSMLSTIGLYFFMSILYLDPWHMLTSSAQYFALLPSYLCTLQIYAFCNTHDISWGTKGDNVLRRDLGAARVTGSSTVELEMPSEQLDIDSCYDEALRMLSNRVEVPQDPPSEAQVQEDYYRAVRTYMVCVWLIANAILAMAVSEAYGYENTGQNGYLAFLLWSVAALALFRASGSVAFLIIRIIHKLAEGRRKFAAANGSGAVDSYSGSYAPTATMHTHSTPPKELPTPVVHRSAKEYVRDSWTEFGWWSKRQGEKLAFWR